MIRATSLSVSFFGLIVGGSGRSQLSEPPSASCTAELVESGSGTPTGTYEHLPRYPPSASAVHPQMTTGSAAVNRRGRASFSLGRVRSFGRLSLFWETKLSAKYVSGVSHPLVSGQGDVLLEGGGGRVDVHRFASRVR